MKIIRKETIIDINNSEKLILDQIKDVENAIKHVSNTTDGKFLLYNGLSK